MSNRIIQEKADSLRVIDDTLFRLIASRREVCQEILRTLLGSPDLVVHQVTVQADGIKLTKAVFRLDREGYAASDIATELSVSEENVKGILEE